MKVTEKEKREVFRLVVNMIMARIRMTMMRTIIMRMTMMTTMTSMMMSRYQQMERNKRRREAKEKEHSSLSSIRWLLIRLDSCHGQNDTI